MDILMYFFVSFMYDLLVVGFVLGILLIGAILYYGHFFILLLFGKDPMNETADTRRPN